MSLTITTDIIGRTAVALSMWLVPWIFGHP